MSAAECPPWCITDHEDVSESGYVSVNHHGAHRRIDVDEAGVYVNVHAFQADGARVLGRPEVAVGSGQACLMLPVFEARELADLLAALGHTSLADAVREVAAEISAEVTS